MGAGGLKLHPAWFSGALDLTDVNRLAFLTRHRSYDHPKAGDHIHFGRYASHTICNNLIKQQYDSFTG
jgi:hypothetical protein